MNKSYLYNGTVTVDLDNEDRLVEFLLAVSHQKTNRKDSVRTSNATTISKEYNRHFM